ncbi:N-acetyltransferase 6-like [Varroa jacobsoni]|uniref:N-acetyltransferase domain-containing protein n=1 Tax=Varroa destructor TaxID=109461 RepID=A0A7M7K919_VARDE|nr:N-acetyltransferase 6-like [Varroa destructor]XP_022659652.1 N-acetyltransferase 6-like [Varroa destructor]XP_022659660.1 N-acetyltransferase 6-like [Varroa destructor]XP_022700979.1 N-acetyltransferase 6-like [Varroa jacobsoni]XP_022700980.1 N-acetyltransferase 6-like [Varroa jacobsoni]XP_022700981.1 N-acetyltransferase 6-like [Varroa jacobsoni]
MVKGACLQLGELQDYPEYMQICCDTLNAEWKRSDTARIYSLQKSSSSLPVSLVMFDSLSREFLGHARLCRILERQDACFIESVIIVADRRGEGLGRELMLLVEAYARDRGFQTAYLTSMNKQAFYTRLGYTFCEAVTASSGCHVSLGGVVRPRVIPAPSTVVPPKNSRQLDSGNSPPPPPLPPVVQQTKRLDRDWMMKTIMT